MAISVARPRLSRSLLIPFGDVALHGDLELPEDAHGVVLFAHGSGSSRHSPRNQFVARTLQASRIGTFLMDLLTEDEEEVDVETRHLRFDIELLSNRLAAAHAFVSELPEAHALPAGFFGASTGAAAALSAAARLGTGVRGVVSRGGRPDLAGSALPLVTAPTLLIVGGYDDVVLRLNREALADMNCEKSLAIVPGATHLFEEPGALESVSRLASTWFLRHFPS